MENLVRSAEELRDAIAAVLVGINDGMWTSQTTRPGLSVIVADDGKVTFRGVMLIECNAVALNSETFTPDLTVTDKESHLDLTVTTTANGGNEETETIKESLASVSTQGNQHREEESRVTAAKEVSTTGVEGKKKDKTTSKYLPASDT